MNQQFEDMTRTSILELCELVRQLSHQILALEHRVAAVEQRTTPPPGLRPGQTWVPGYVSPGPVIMPFMNLASPPGQVPCANGAHNG